MLNALAGYEAAIVTEVEGTTRDVLRERIQIDGMPLHIIDTAGLRESSDRVEQEGIRRAHEEIKKAAKAAYAYDFIIRFPDQFDTGIGELGGRLSGGEKQRICIARALLKDAPVLILDEATSSLDMESEMLVQKALENLMLGRTTFVIAHRLSTVDYADRIVVIADGRIKEEGTQKELLAQKREYYKLYKMQYANNHIDTLKMQNNQ